MPSILTMTWRIPTHVRKSPEHKIRVYRFRLAQDSDADNDNFKKWNDVLENHDIIANSQFRLGGLEKAKNLAGTTNK